VLLAGLQSLPGDGTRLGIPLLVNYLQNLVQEGLSGGSEFLNRPPFVAKADGQWDGGYARASAFMDLCSAANPCRVAMAFAV
jgi:hypothetical protein